MEEHNRSLPSTDHLNIDDIFNALKKMGGTSEENLKDVTWEDLQQCGLPRILARNIANVFRHKSQDVFHRENIPLSTARVEALSYEELLKLYTPLDKGRGTKVANRLKELAGDKPFIAFKSPNEVDVDISVGLLKELLSGLPPLKQVVVNEKVYKLYCVGEREYESLIENPLFPGEALRTNEVCPHLNRSWSKISHRVRQVIYLAYTKTKELLMNDNMGMHTVMDLAEKSENLSTRFPKACLMLQELESTGQAPLLRVRLGATSSKKNDPFGTHVRT